MFHNRIRKFSRASFRVSYKSVVIGIAVVIVGLLASTQPAFSATNQLTKENSQYITAGATLTNYRWDISDGTVKASVIEVDLSNPYVQLQIVPGKGTFTTRATVTAMANRTGAIAMVNGDFFNMAAEGAPIGTTVIDGELESSQSNLTGVYCLGITKDRMAEIDVFGFKGTVSNEYGQKYNLSGLNKTYYWEETTTYHSHINRLHLYNDLWSGGKRGMDSYVGLPTEILIKDGIVQQISKDALLEGGVPEGCFILHGDGKAAEFLQAAFMVGDKINIDYQITPEKDWQLVIGGHALLLDKGQIVDYTKDLNALGGIRARTAIGISKDGKKIYIVAVEGRTKESAGITLGNLSLLMQKLGIYKAVNLDGGGSTAMVVRELAAINRTRVINPERNGSERSVVEGLGVYSTAPKGSLQGAFISGEKNLLVGETQTYTVRAYDTYYNTIEDTSSFLMTESKGLGTLIGRTFTAETVGETVLSIGEGDTKSDFTIRIIGKDGLQSLALTPDSQQYEDGSAVQFAVAATLVDGATKKVATSALKWSVSAEDDSFIAVMDGNGKLTIEAIGTAKSATVNASYDGFETSYELDFRKSGILILTLDEKTMKKGEERVTMDVAPYSLNGRTMVPLSFVVKSLDGEAYWDGAVRTALAICNGNLVELPIDSETIYVNGEEMTIDMPAQIIDGRTMVPLRFLIESFGMQVDYNSEDRTVIISD